MIRFLTGRPFVYKSLRIENGKNSCEYSDKYKMRPDPNSEEFHITKIAEGLKKIKSLASDPGNETINIELAAMEISVNWYMQAINGDLPIFYGIEQIKESCHYIASAMDLVRLFERIDKKKLKPLRAHLKLIGKGGFGIYGTYQKQLHNGSSLHDKLILEIKTDPNKEIARDAVRKSIELMLALACLSKYDKVLLEDPENSCDTKPNPDLIVKDGGSSYGIACKSIISESGENFKGHIRKAIGQIEKAVDKGRVDPGRGLVFIDVSPHLDHDKLYMPDTDHYWQAADAPKLLAFELDRALFRILGEGDLGKKLSPLFSNTQVAPCVVIYAHSLIIGSSELGVNPRYYKAMTVVQCGDHSKVANFLTDLNKANQGQ